MSIFVFISVLFAALLHAGWNALIKNGVDKQAGMLLLTLGHAFIGLCFIPFFPVPTGQVWLWLLASGIIHTFYQLFLGFAYERGDLSRVYPIARGAAPMIVLVVSLLFGLDKLDFYDLIGASVIGIGILLMGLGIFNLGEDRTLIPLALGSAFATAGYSIIDGMGARLMGDAFSYVSWLLIFSAIFYVPVIFSIKGQSVFPKNRKQLSLGLLVGGTSFLAYAIVVWAMTQAPIAVVTALRESSILFAVIIGYFFFGDRMTFNKILAAFVIVIGIVLTRY